MKLDTPLVPDYDHQEERINYLSHGIGAALALIGGIFLLIKGAYLSTGQWLGLWAYAIINGVAAFLPLCCITWQLLQTAAIFIKRSHHLLFNCRHLHPFLSIAIPTPKTIFINCTVDHCPNWPCSNWYLSTVFIKFL